MQKKPELEKQKQRDYYNILLPELAVGDRIDKMAEDVVLPEIGEAPTEAKERLVPTTPENIKPGDSVKPISNEELEQKLNELNNSLQDLKREERLQSISKEIMDALEDRITPLEKKLNALFERKVFERQYFDTEDAYKENLFNICVGILDKLLVPIIPASIDYSLISTQVTSTYEDGTVENAIVNINIIVPYEGYKYEFKVEVPILGGVIQSPMYLKRGQKVIPLVEPAIMNELATFSFREVPNNDYSERGNMFNNIGENPLRRPNNQLHYDIRNTTPPSVQVPSRSKWNPRGERNI